MTEKPEQAQPSPNKAAAETGGDNVSKWHNRESYFFNQGGNLAVWAIYVSLNIGMAVWGVWEFAKPHWTTDSDLLRITLPIARAGGRLVTFNTALILITASKYVWTLIRHFTVIPYGFPVDNIMPEYHRYVALNIIASGLIVHTIPQIINYATQEIEIVDGKPVWTFGDGFSTKQLLITGSMLAFIFTMFFLTTLSRVRKGSTIGFRFFWWFHVFGIVTAIPLLLIHGTLRGGPILLYFTIVPFGLYLADVSIRRWIFVSREAEVIEWKTTPPDDEEKVTKLVLNCSGGGFTYTPGQYAELKIPQLSKYEWHPFTIASAPRNANDGTVTFYIKAVGRWTNELFDLSSKHDNNDSTFPVVHVRGPFGAPAANYLAYQHLIVIGSGIGVTPLLSIWQYLAHHGSKLVCKNTPGLDDSVADTVDLSLEFDSSEESEEDLLDRLTTGNGINSVDVVALERQLSKRKQASSMKLSAAYYASCLESMMVNICLFCSSLLMETIVFSIWIFNYDKEAAFLQIVISGIAVIIFLAKILLSIVAYGIVRYGRSYVCWLELGIVVLDAGAIVSSLITITEPTPSKEAVVAYFAFFAAFILLHGVRIFHIFHCTARPPVAMEAQQAKKYKKGEERIQSITGIWVSRYYASMGFAIDDLMEDASKLPSAFSLKLFATREKKPTKKASKKDSSCKEYGRPDWKKIFQTAITKAHASNPEGAVVGVFFCGSPAIARDLQRAAQLVTAQHQQKIQQETGTVGRSRILVHKENF